MSKSLFASKTFWFNVAAAAIEVTGVLPVPPATAATVAAVGNIVLRVLTTQPVHLQPRPALTVVGTLQPPPRRRRPRP